MRIRKYQHEGIIQRSDNTTVTRPVITNLPLEDDANSRVTREYKLRKAKTDAQRLEEEEAYRRMYGTTVESYDWNAHHGWPEVDLDSNSDDVIWHFPTTTSIKPKSEGRKMLESPAFQMAAGFLLDVPLIAGGLRTKTLAPIVKKTYSSPELMINTIRAGNDVISTGRNYYIENFPGHHIKALMRNNPLEYLLSLEGTIAVNNIRLYMTNRSRMELDIVDLVLALPQFKGKSKIDYNTFRKAVQDQLLIPGSNLQREYDYGIEYPLLKFNVGFNRNDPVMHISNFSLGDPNVPTIANGFISSMTEKRLALRNAEIDLLLKELVKLAPDQSVSSLYFGLDVKPEYKGISKKMKSLLTEFLDNEREIKKIQRVSGGTKYFLVKHLKSDYTTKLIQETLQRAALYTRSKVEYPNTPDIIRRLKAMKLDYTIEGDHVIVNVPKNYSEKEILFRTGGILKK